MVKSFADYEVKSQQNTQCNPSKKSIIVGGRGVRTEKFKIVAKGVDKFTHCTIYGFVYDERKIKKEWLK